MEGARPAPIDVTGQLPLQDVAFIQSVMRQEADRTGALPSRLHPLARRRAIKARRTAALEEIEKIRSHSEASRGEPRLGFFARRRKRKAEKAAIARSRAEAREIKAQAKALKAQAKKTKAEGKAALIEAKARARLLDEERAKLRDKRARAAKASKGPGFLSRLRAAVKRPVRPHPRRARYGPSFVRGHTAVRHVVVGRR